MEKLDIKKCPFCGMLIDNNFPIWQNFCPRCGSRLKECDTSKCSNCKAKYGVNSCYFNRGNKHEQV